MVAPAQPPQPETSRAGVLPSQILADAPLLGVLAGAAAIVDLLLNRGAVRTLAGRMSHADLLVLARWGQVPKNLAAIAGLVALAAALAHFLSAPRQGRVARGLGLAGFGGIFLPIVAVATILPPEFLARRWGYLIVFAVGAGNVLAILVSSTAARRPGPAGLRIATMLVGGGCFLSFAAMALSNITLIDHTGIGHTFRISLERAGEVVWLLAPVSAAASIVPRPRDRSSIVALLLGALATGAVFAGGLWARNILRADFGDVVYGISSGNLFDDSLPSIYLLLLALGIGIAVAALATREAIHVQSGAALLLLLSAGFAPRAPLRLLVMVLGASMLARASICLGERLVAARQKATQEAQDEKERASLADLDRSLSDAPRPVDGE